MKTTITICSTCRFGPDLPTNGEGKTGGEILAGLVGAGLDGTEPIAVRAHECLWACRQRCTVLFSSVGGPSYLAGRFEPEGSAAEAIIAWARAYAASGTGVVAFRDWPEGIKGHFIARLPVLEENEDER
ncbi:DUF1636 domain-containing protein [Arsenicitalea aurantiaca]|uniref:DUF1636 domain-containing protein n=1 Tax=Arsenicitalea aurantiaca TaxID=1783274 RepID=A0A433X3X0_9HYPH|nr:DUF1636 domain-containing protein [Arsenicitalea aurantiaca]RUT28773.1 DUF1636 domain-containing protein [Arsenicitalea aurantiaca]